MNSNRMISAIQSIPTAAWFAGCIVITIGLFAFSIFLAPVMDGQRAIRNWYLHGNIKMTKTAAEAYASKFKRYPARVEDMATLFPGGPAMKEGTRRNEIILPPGSAPVNPITWKSEWPRSVQYENEGLLRANLAKVDCAPGSIIYVHIENPDGYALIARDSFSAIELSTPRGMERFPNLL